MFRLKINDDGRILYACKELPGNDYSHLTAVDTLPEGDVTDWLCIDGQYIYDPLPEQEQAEPARTTEERLTELEEAFAMILSGVTE